jgi:type I restriction enzyme R subunit
MEAAKAERYAYGDPRTSCFYARRSLELALAWLYDAEVSLVRPYRDDLSALIATPSLGQLVEPWLRTKMDLVRRQGNDAVHRQAPVAPTTSVRTVGELFHILYWLARTYACTPESQPQPGLSFDATIIPRPLPPGEQVKRRPEVQALAAKAEAQDKELAEARKRTENLDAEITRLRAEVAAAKAANAARLGADIHDYREDETRTFRIDVLLKEAGWPLDRPEDREFLVTGMPVIAKNKSGTGRVDYVLWDDNGKPLGLVEAKRTAKDARAGRHQAKLYADCLEAQFGQRPVIFYSNGYETWLWDDLDYPPREVLSFYTKDELRLLIQRRTSRKKLATERINHEIAGRPYQERAIRAIAETLERDKRRKALLVMATGAGKTRTVVGLVDLLTRANWVKRVLFLADRKTLVKQAANAFKAHLPGVPAVNLLTEKNPDARVVVSTYPTMLNLINDVDGRAGRYGPGYFDLVVVDEAHRSIYQKYGSIFDWFDAPLVGLTATPKDEVDRNTYRMFDLQDGVPTDVYSLDEAIHDKFLVPPTAVDVPTKFLRGGIRYADLSEEEKDRWEELDWSDDGQIPDEVSTEELNKYLFNDDTVDKTMAALMEHGLKVAGGDRLGKTIVFAKNRRHAEFIGERFNRNYPQYLGEFAQVITADKDYAEHLIDTFSQTEKTPHIAISVDMLDTGVDVPDVVNLVFFKLVRSKTKYWQMIGRGTRLRPDLYGPGKHKDGFLIFDLCQNIEYFNQDVVRAEPNLPKPLGQRLFETRVDLLTTLDQQQTDPDLRRDVATRLHAEVAGMPPENVLVRKQAEHVQLYAKFDSWHTLAPAARDQIVEHLAALPTAYREPGEDHSEEAKRFDLLALKLQLAVLTGDPKFAGLRDKAKQIASLLLDQLTIPAIRAQQALLDELAEDAWWQDVTPAMLETMRKKVRGLVRLIEKTRKNVVYSDFEDELGELRVAQLRGVHLGTDMKKFETKARAYLIEHEDQLAVQKLYRNRQITQTDLSELERILIEQGIGSEADIEQAKAQSEGEFGLFLRGIRGLDRAAVVEALAEFQAGQALTGNQLHFVNLVTEYLARNGVIPIEALYEPPFSAVAPQGPEQLFAESKVDVLVTALHEVRQRAIPIRPAA